MTPSGKVSLVNFVPTKASSPIFLRVLGNTTSFKLEYENAFEPISVTPSGITNLFIPVEENNPFGIIFQSPRNTTSFRFLCPSNGEEAELNCDGKLTLVRVGKALS